MSTSRELKTTERDTTLTPRQLRAAGYVPATVYGKGMEPRCIQVRAHEFVQLFLQGVREFQLTGFVSFNAKLQQVQRDPVSQAPISAQFLQVDGQAAPKAKAAKASKQEAPKSEAAEQPETALSGV